MSDGDPSNEEILAEVRSLRQKFMQLTEDFNTLRHEVNNLEKRVDEVQRVRRD